MSINYNIAETVTTPLRTDILADCGWDRYHIYASLLREHYNVEDDTICDVYYRRNPAVANQMIFFGDAYYTELSFNNPALFDGVWSTTNEYRFFTLSKMSFDYSSGSSLLYVKCEGITYSHTYYHGSSPWYGTLGAYKLNEISDIDFSKPFMFHWVNIPMKDGTGEIYDNICNKGMILSLLRKYISRYPYIYEYAQQYFTGGGLDMYFVCDSPDGFNYSRGLRISYTNTSGQLTDLPYQDFLTHDYSTLIRTTTPHSTLWVLTDDLFKGHSMLIPMTISEYEASDSANYRYNDWQFVMDAIAEYEE